MSAACGCSQVTTLLYSLFADFSRFLGFPDASDLRLRRMIGDQFKFKQVIIQIVRKSK